MIKHATSGQQSFKGKRVAISGSGNVAQYAALKAIDLGATIISLSDSKGCLVATGDAGFTPEQVATIAQLKVDRKQLSELASADGFKDKLKYVDGERPWKHVGKVDIALPSATQNEVSADEAKALIEAGARFIAEGSNMGCSQEAIDIFEENRRQKKGEAIWYAPGKSPFPSAVQSLHTHVRLLTQNNRQSSQRRRRGRLGARNGAEFPTHVLDGGGSRWQAQGHHGSVFHQWPRDGEEVCGAQGGRVSQFGGGKQYCGL